MLVDKYSNIETVSCGALLRNKALEDSPEGKTVKEFVNAGKLVSSYIVFDLLKTFIEESEKEVILVDGFPRN